MMKPFFLVDGREPAWTGKYVGMPEKPEWLPEVLDCGILMDASYMDL